MKGWRNWMDVMGLKGRPPEEEVEPVLMTRYAPGLTMTLVYDRDDGIYFIYKAGSNRLPIFPAEIYRMKSMLKEVTRPPKPTEMQRMFAFIKRLLEGDDSLGGRWEIHAIEHLLIEMDLGGMIDASHND